MGELLDKYILTGGSANPPKDTGVYNLYSVVSISLYVNRRTHCVERVKVNVPSELTQEYLADIITGYCLMDSPEKLFQTIKENVLLSSVNAVNQALKVAFARYKDKVGI